MGATEEVAAHLGAGDRSAGDADLVLVSWGRADEADVAGFEVTDPAEWATELGS